MEIHPIGFVSQLSTEPGGEILATLQLVDPVLAEVLANPQKSSHLEIIYCTQFAEDRHPNVAFTIVELLRHQEGTLTVKFPKAQQGAVILGIKPAFNSSAIMPQTNQPTWVKRLMKNYWRF